MREIMTRRVFVLAGCVIAGAALAWPAAPRSAAAAVDPLAGYAPLDAGTLGQMRAGLWVGNLKLDFAVRLETVLRQAEELIALRTVLRLNEHADGFQSARTEVASSGPSGASSAEVAAETSGTPKAVELTLGPDITRMVHSITKNGAEAIVANTADGVTISHDVNLDITLPQFNVVTQNFLTRSRIARIARDAGLGGLVRP